MVAWAQAPRQLYNDARAWLAEHPTAPAEARRRQYAALYERAGSLGLQYAQTSTHPCRALAKRLLRHQDELFQFVLVPGVPADNNLAERSLRPLVILRKISGGTRSEEGSKTRLTLASLFGTWQARQLNPFEECLAALRVPCLPLQPLRPKLLYPNGERLRSWQCSGRPSVIVEDQLVRLHRHILSKKPCVGPDDLSRGDFAVRA